MADDRDTFWKWVAFAQVLILISFGFLLAWIFGGMGGLDWKHGYSQFNYHPLLMIFAMIYLYAEAILTFRVMRGTGTTSKIRKIVHGVIQLAACLCMIVGMYAVIDFHIYYGLTNFYSLHDWLGILTIISFFGEWIMGFSFYLFPTVSAPLRNWYRSVHIYCGLIIFAMAMTTCCMGIHAKIIYTTDYYDDLPFLAWSGNVLGITLVAIFAVVWYTVMKVDNKKASSEPTEETPLTPSESQSAQ